jgi:hypothetical protein
MVLPLAELASSGVITVVAESQSSMRDWWPHAHILKAVTSFVWATENIFVSNFPINIEGHFLRPHFSQDRFDHGQRADKSFGDVDPRANRGCALIFDGWNGEFSCLWHSGSNPYPMHDFSSWRLPSIGNLQSGNNIAGLLSNNFGLSPICDCLANAAPVVDISITDHDISPQLRAGGLYLSVSDPEEPAGDQCQENS